METRERKGVGKWLCVEKTESRRNESKEIKKMKKKIRR